jgi:hypothetical protein
MPIIGASLYRAVFIKNLLRYHPEKILLWNTTNIRGDYPAILGFLMPVFVDIMMDHPGEDWGKPFYPVVA